MKSIFCAAAFSTILFLSCAGGPEEAADAPRAESGYDVSARGRIEELGMTVWMYGSHGLADPDTGEYLYALTSDSVNLPRFEGSVVTVRGNLIGGYPVDTGPPYLEVYEVEP